MGRTCGCPTTRHPRPAPSAARCSQPGRPRQPRTARSPRATPAARRLQHHRPGRRTDPLQRHARTATAGSACPSATSAGALMFDASQPCKQSETVDAADRNDRRCTTAQHTLKITVTDAAQNTQRRLRRARSAPTTHPPNTAAPTIAAAGAAAGRQQRSPPNPAHGPRPPAPAPITYAYQWQDCNAEGSDCQTIPGAEGATYTATRRRRRTHPARRRQRQRQRRVDHAAERTQRGDPRSHADGGREHAAARAFTRRSRTATGRQPAPHSSAWTEPARSDAQLRRAGAQAHRAADERDRRPDRRRDAGRQRTGHRAAQRSR